MKSIFKKIAFVLALAMVVTAFPAKTAAAADEPTLKAKRTLYIGGDATEQYAESAWASVKKGDYTVAFASKDEKIVTVNAKNGRLHAVSVGETVVTATFSKDGEKEIVKECAVKVKQNAGAVTLEETSAEMYVGDKITIKATPENENTTDKIHFAPKADADKEIIDVDYDNGEITAKAEGTATVLVYATQWEYNKDTKKWAKKVTTEKVEFAVTVKKAGFAAAKQVSADTVEITCDNEAAAKAAVANVTKIKAAYVLNNNDITTYVKSVVADANDAKVIKVTLYSAMTKDVVYNFSYDGGSVVAVKGADLNAPTSIEITTTKAKVNTETEIKVQFKNAEGVVVNQGNLANLTFTADASTDYSVYANKIFFYNVGKSATVNVTYNMGYAADGTKIPDLTATGIITSLAAYSTEDINGYALVADDYAGAADAWPISYSTEVLNLVKGENKKLIGRYSAPKYEGNVATFYTYSSNTAQTEVLNGVTFEFVSTNDAIVIVDKTTGILRPVSAGNAQVIIYRVVGLNKTVVGAASVHVEGGRTLSSFTASANKNLLADNSTNVGVAGTVQDSVSIKFDVKDQLSTSIRDAASMSYYVKLLQNVPGVTVSAIGNIVAGQLTTTEQSVATLSGIGYSGDKGIVLTAEADSATQAKTVHVAIIARQAGTNIEKTQVVPLSVKKSGADATYSLNLSNANIDMNLPTIMANNQDMNALKCSISLSATDAQGYYVRNISLECDSPMPTTNGAFSYQVKKGVNPVTIGASNVFEVTSGSSPITKKAGIAGTYSVTVYKGVAGQAQLIAAKTINVTDSTVTPVVTVKDTSVATADNGTVLAKIQAMYASGDLVITRQGANLAWNSDVTIVIDSAATTVSATTPDRIYVDYITVTETYGKSLNKSFVYNIPVGKVFYVPQP